MVWIVVRRIVASPFFIVLPVVALLYIGWSHYLYASQDFNLSRNNLMPENGFTHLQKNGLPTGWQLTTQGDTRYSLATSPGHVDKTALLLHVTKATNGDVALQTPILTTDPNKQYLFKGYYNASEQFDFLVRYFYADGTSNLELLHSYAGTAKTSWTTVSDAFASGSNITAVQFVYRLSSVGDLKLDGTFFEPQSGLLYVDPPVTPTGANLVPGISANGCQDDTVPNSWSIFQSGANDSYFSYACEQNAPTFYMTTTAYQNGQAKWQYDPLPVVKGNRYMYQASYMSSAPLAIVAEYLSTAGTRSFATIAHVSPADEWTSFTAYTEAPADGTLFVSAVLQTDGSAGLRSPALYNVTKFKGRQFQGPHISVVFNSDDQQTFQDGLLPLNADGLKATYAVTPLEVDTGKFVTSSQVQTVVRHGNELAASSFGQVDLTTISEGALASQLANARSYVQQQSHAKHIDFVVPYTVNDPQLQAYIRRDFMAGLGVETGINTSQSMDKYNLDVVFVGPKTTLAELEGDIQNARTYNGWLILVYSKVGQNAGAQTVSEASFQKQLLLLKQSKIPVLSVRDTLQTLQPH